LRAYELSKRVGEDIIRADAAIKIALAYDTMGERVKALAYLEEAIALHDRLGDHASAIYAGCTAALIAFKLHGDAGTLEAYRLAVERQRERGAPWRTAYAEMDLAEAYHCFGKTDEAIALLTPAIARLHETASPNDVGNALNNLGAYLTSAGRFVEAIPIAREALQIGRDGNFTRIIVLAVQTCATIAARTGCEKQRCAQLFGYVARRYDRIGLNEYTETSAHERFTAVVDAMLSKFDRTAAIREGEMFDDEMAIDAALQCLAHARTAEAASA
jgi:tetratricopeptide (TPR) repeat protein